MFICRPSSGQYVASHQANLPLSISSIYAARHFVHMPPAIMTICHLPLCLYTAFHHVYMPPSIMSIKYYCSSAIKHRLNTAFQAFGEGGSIFCDVSQVYLEPSSNSQDCRRRKGIPCKVWGKDFRLA